MKYLQIINKAQVLLFFWKKGLVFLLLVVIQNVFAQIHVSDSTLLHSENEESLYVLNAEVNFSAEIYITPGATVTNLENDGKYEIIAISQPQISNLTVALAKIEVVEIESTNTVGEDQKLVIPSKNNISFFENSDPDVISAEFSKTAVTLLPANYSYPKILVVLPKSKLETIHLLQKQSNVFLYSDAFFCNVYSSNFSARPPPTFS